MPLNFVAKAAITVAMMAANMALTMSRKIEGPRLDDLKATGADYGTPLYDIWGMRRVEVPIFWAEDMREVKRRRKTKGGKYNEYTYYGTWAVALAGHELAGVRRVWFDTHLVYDLSGGGPVTPFDFGSNGGNISEKIAIYLGTETQEADPRMEATVEAQHGEGSCPAYRGTSYIVFKDIPLEKLGNRIPQVSVEVVSVATPSYPYETTATQTAQPNRLWNFTFSTDHSRFMWAGTSSYEIWDTAARSRMIAGTLPASINLSSRLGMYADGHFLAISGNNEKVLRFSADGTGVSTLQDHGGSGPSRDQEEVRVLADGNGREHWMTIPYSVNRYFFVNGVERRMLDTTGIDWTPLDYFADQHGDIWAVGREPGTGKTTCYFYRVVNVSGRGGNSFFFATGLASTSGTLGDIAAVHYIDATKDQFVIHWEHNYLYTIEIDTGTVLNNRTYGSLDVYNTDKQFANCPVGASTIWLNLDEVSLSDLTSVRTVTANDWKNEDADGVIYDPVNHALICAPQFTQVLTFRYLDRLGAPSVTLGDILSDVADSCGVVDYDFSALDQIVKGWSSTRGQASSKTEPLLDAFDSDIRPHDFTIQGLKRAGVASGSTLATARFVGEPRYTVKVRQAAELPRAMIVDFADIDADQQPNSKRVSRPLDATDARGEQKLDLTTLTLNVDDASQLAERYFRRVWNERKQPQLSLTAQNIGLEPGDVRTLELDGTTVTARATRVLVRADDTIQTEWKYDNASLATFDGSAGAPFDGRTVSTIAVPLISKGFIFDIPLLTDADDSASPLLYAAAGPYADGTWPGAVIFEETGGEYSDEFASVASSSPVTWGYVSSAMPDANPNLWDRGTVLTVTLQTGELIGCTEAEANADPTLNLIAIGNLGRWELLQFTTATLVTGKTYTVSGFKRGRRGTEWAASLHEANDQFILLDTAQDETRGLSDVGTELSFMAITSGRTSGFPVTLSNFDGNSLKPYAPANVRAVREASDDWTLTWARRTRVGGAWTSGTSIPLSEASEAYEVDILNGSTVVRTISVTSPTATYTAAQQTTDFGAPQSSLTYRVYQISAAVGRGF